MCGEITPILCNLSNLIIREFQVEIALWDFVDMAINSPSKLGEKAARIRPAQIEKFQLNYVKLLMGLVSKIINT